MASKNFKAKVEQLAQLKVEFDDANSAGENQVALPQQINSKQKYEVGPTNNARQTYRRRNKAIQFREGGGAGLGFADKADSAESQDDEEEAKESRLGALANRMFQPAQAKENSQRSQFGSQQQPALVGGQMTITKMVRNFREANP